MFNNLPNECIADITCFFYPEDIKKIYQVCKITKQALDEDEKYIKENCVHHIQPHGKMYTLYNSGIVQSTSTYDEGVEDGVYTGWYEDGTLNETATFIDGKLHGQYIEYEKDGRVKEITNYNYGEYLGIEVDIKLEI
jgi:antitoxin component YwqK of YwqJK toxin-antitoxin module